MSPSEPVRRRHRIAGATPRDIFDVVIDFAAYPRLFPEFKQVRLVSTRPGTLEGSPRPPAMGSGEQSSPAPDAPAGHVARVEFRAQMVVSVRYVLDLNCRMDVPSVDWKFVEGEIVTGSTGSWRFTPEGADTLVDYAASLEVKAPLPGFVLRKVTDGLVSASLPAMFSSIEREVRARQRGRPETSGLPGT